MSTESTNSLETIWEKALTQLQLLYSAASYQTWIAPIVVLSVNHNNKLTLNCPSEFAKDWIESRYKKDIIETVRSIEPSVEGIIVRVGGKAVQSQETTNEPLFLEIDEPLFQLMRQVYERETENTIGCSFEKYFNSVIQSHCQGRMGGDQ